MIISAGNKGIPSLNEELTLVCLLCPQCNVMMVMNAEEAGKLERNEESMLCWMWNVCKDDGHSMHKLRGKLDVRRMKYSVRE